MCELHGRFFPGPLACQFCQMTVLEADDGILGRSEKFPDRFASVSVAQEQMDIELLGLNW